MRDHHHWQEIYTTRDPTSLSWYQEAPEPSLSWVEEAQPDKHKPLIDVGGGASTLVDGLLDSGYTEITVLDIAPQALLFAQQRLGERGNRVTWIATDVLDLKPHTTYQTWHDRAVFHFLTRPDAQQRYVDVVRRALAPGGHVILATFSKEGPEQCSGLPVMRHDAASIKAIFGDDFVLQRSRPSLHHTPSGAEQAYLTAELRYAPHHRKAT